jgi:hypothetical protein
MGMENHGEAIIPAGKNPWLVHQSSLSILPAVIWEQVGGMNETSENFALQAFRSYTQVIFTCRKILRHGASGRTSYPKEGVLWIFIALKKSIASAGFESATLGSSDKHTNHYTTEVTNAFIPKQISNLLFNICGEMGKRCGREYYTLFSLTDISAIDVHSPWKCGISLMKA